MKQDIQQSAKLQQTQKASQQQIQSLEILYAPVLELSSLISSELSKNPVLEVSPEKYEPLEVESISNEEMTQPDKENWLEHIIQTSYSSSSETSGQVSPESIEERRHFLDSLNSESSLYVNLKEQLNLLELDDKMAAYCDAIISSMNDNGYLSYPPADLAMAYGYDLEGITEAVTTLQSLEPAGIATTNLQERLLIQLKRLGHEDSLAYLIVKKYLYDIAENKLPAVCKEQQITMSELKLALEEIRKLNPHLPFQDSVKEHQYIREEVSIEHDSHGNLKVRVLNGRLPRLRISPYYKKLIEGGHCSSEVLEYIQDKITGGLAFINFLHQRQSTIENIAMAILERQSEFFNQGISFLKPLTMAEIAIICNVHETTVSRTVSGKYLRCQFGLFPMRYFFSHGCPINGGTAVSSTFVKEIIRLLIKKENPKKPLSDGSITTLLEKRDINIKRRTVAKYREELGVLAAHLRRQY